MGSEERNASILINKCITVADSRERKREKVKFTVAAFQSKNEENIPDDKIQRKNAKGERKGRSEENQPKDRTIQE